MTDPARKPRPGSGSGLCARRRGRPKKVPSARLSAPGRDFVPDMPKGGRLPSLMFHMINRRALCVVILLSAFLLAGCSGVFGPSPGERADRAISEANGAIEEHNRLLDDARRPHAGAKKRTRAATH